MEDGACRLLIDCGLSLRALERRLAEAGAGAAAFDAVLVTHSHDDHVAGLRRLVDRTGATLYANAMTAEAVCARQGVAEEAFALFENGQSFDVGSFAILPFSIPHDTSDPVGYLVTAADGTAYFHGTDIGTPLESIGAYFARADWATLESNHDPVMLRQSGRAESLVRRIAGPRGHLSNDDACAFVRRFASARLKRLALAHLSEDCNAPHLAERAMRETLRDIRRDDVVLRVLPQTGCVCV